MDPLTSVLYFHGRTIIHPEINVLLSGSMTVHPTVLLRVMLVLRVREALLSLFPV